MAHPTLGALPDDNGVLFRVWSPPSESVTLVLEPDAKEVSLEPVGQGYFEAHVAGIEAGRRYRYSLDDGHPLPDPASRYQPDGVHGPSEIVDPRAYAWNDEEWKGIEPPDLIFYELHVGTFTPEGRFESTLERLEYLRDLGVTAIELMPVADFPGDRNWGYDQAALFAPSRAYGRPDDLRHLVDTAHRLGMAVYLDVIYNHLGPDGAYAAAFAPFFTDKYETPWGEAINFDDDNSFGVRDFFVQNASHWLKEYHFDGLRLDATFAIEDHSDTHFLAQLSDAVAEITHGPDRVLIAEDHRNENILVRPRSEGGYGLDAVWVDDFHHQIRNMTAGDTQGYFGDYAGSTTRNLSETIERGWYFDGRPSPTTGTPRGSDPEPVEPNQCVYCIQNHDQVGNRPTGNRLTDDISLPAYRAVSSLLLFLPQLPLLFMGQEWAASAPFLYFTDHNDELGALVREGRMEEFEHIAGFEGTIPDPQASATFEDSKLDWDERTDPGHREVETMYRDLIELRGHLDGSVHTTVHSETALTVTRGAHELHLSITGGESIPFDAGSDILWHSEQPAYAEEAQPPEITDRGLSFPGPLAVVTSTSDER